MKLSLQTFIAFLCTPQPPADAFLRTTSGFAHFGVHGVSNAKISGVASPSLRHHPTRSFNSPRFQSNALSMSFPAATASIETIKGIVSRRPTLAVFAFVFLLFSTKWRNPQTILWPGASIDKDCDALVPEGSFGCPFIGYNIFSGSKDYGPLAYLGKLSRKHGNVFKTYTYGVPIVSVSGVDNVKSLLKNEFKKGGIGTFLIGGSTNMGQLFGQDMLLYENDAEKHSTLRRLVATAMTPSAISAAIPSIRDAAKGLVDKIVEASNNSIKMEDVFVSYTLDIAWKQILGLDLKEEDVPEFHNAVNDWTKGIMSPLLLMPFKIPGIMRFTKAGRARRYLGSKIDEKISKLERDGPDSSTFSKLYFATDEDGTTKLTRQQVVENALLLIFAGSETSSSTLTCAALFLALHPDVWEKVREEQRDIISKYGDDINAEILEKCIYLDAVVRETLRIQPIETGELRSVENTVVVDGKQIPKGWNVFFNVRQTHFNDPVTYQKDGSHMDHYKGFKPERWLDKATKPVEWIPFGDGQRRCVGERLANTEMKIFLAMLARKVAKFELVNKGDKLQWQTDTIMARPADGVLCSVMPV